MCVYKCVYVVHTVITYHTKDQPKRLAIENLVFIISKLLLARRQGQAQEGLAGGVRRVLTGNPGSDQQSAAQSAFCLELVLRELLLESPV